MGGRGYPPHAAEIAAVAAARELYPTDRAARVLFEERRWPEGTRCPWCRRDWGKRPRPASGLFQCAGCVATFSVRTGTILKWSPLPLHKWLYAFAYLGAARLRPSCWRMASLCRMQANTAVRIIHRMRAVAGGTLENLERQPLSVLVDAVLDFRPHDDLKRPRGWQVKPLWSRRDSQE